MRILLLSTSLLLISFLPRAKAQNHITGKVNLTHSLWTFTTANSPDYGTLGTNEEDTVLNDGLTYLKLFSSVDTVITGNVSYLGGVRFDSVSNRVYFKRAGDAVKILFDFNLNTGDTLTNAKGYYLFNETDSVPAFHKAIVSKVDTVQTLDGILRKRFVILNTTIIEGIGNVSNHLLSYTDFLTTGDLPGFLCYKNKGNCIYTNTDCTQCHTRYTGINESYHDKASLSVYPNPVYNQLYIQHIDMTNAQLFVYNTSGKLVLATEANSFSIAAPLDVSSLAAGIYYGVITNLNGERYTGKFVKE